MPAPDQLRIRHVWGYVQPPRQSFDRTGRCWLDADPPTWEWPAIREREASHARLAELLATPAPWEDEPRWFDRVPVWVWVALFLLLLGLAGAADRGVI